MLFDREIVLLINDTAERTIAAKLAQYLHICFPDHDVDVEYNRMGDVPKRLLVEGTFESVYPDIIVHSRMKQVNILALELKKDSNPEKRWKDLNKLAAYRTELGYSHALFLRLGTGADAGTVSECEWILESIFRMTTGR